MRYIDRTKTSVPASLEPGGRGESELHLARAYYANVRPNKAYDFEAYKGDDVKIALHQLFHGKCAYCEAFYAATQPVDVEHFRPKSRVKEHPDHPGYWWLAMAWDNLLPSCIDCNRRRRQFAVLPGMTLDDVKLAFARISETNSGKEDAFPTRNNSWCSPEEDPEGLEQPLLIDPTKSDPALHINWDFRGDVPLAVPVDLSDQGSESISLYGLNRLNLVQARHHKLVELRVMMDLIEEMCSVMDALDVGRQAKQIEKISRYTDQLEKFANADAPFSSMARVLIDQFRNRLQSLLNQSPLT